MQYKNKLIRIHSAPNTRQERRQRKKKKQQELYKTNPGKSKIISRSHSFIFVFVCVCVCVYVGVCELSCEYALTQLCMHVPLSRFHCRITNREHLRKWRARGLKKTKQYDGSQWFFFTSFFFFFFEYWFSQFHLLSSVQFDFYVNVKTCAYI